tara:strand:+ start:3825 stop:4022 length:198 start_codon:yes stop_codon:yes gene_type:complete
MERSNPDSPIDSALSPEVMTLTPYDLVESEGSCASGHYERFNNWSNWGNGPTDPGVENRGYQAFN